MTGDRIQESVDPDLDVTDVTTAPPRPRAAGQLPIVVAVSLGGGLGAAARYGVTLAWPTTAGSFPWAVWSVNVAGCALLGVVLVLVTEVRDAHRLLRPFLGTGVLGGFTTFSTYAVDAQALVQAGRPGLALTSAAATLVAALASVWLAVTATRAVSRQVRGSRRQGEAGA
ncbi:fluoride efflux transporter CrcB [Saccharomonospora piscinae]|uniref:fluoride efflux transporter CrcB n=1 Tax=Saccharomonospora piscinae TaxID=687388 RepID=UPI000462F757|nr:fluoride efflux transporter CrcB [Saccharomonospora piscinae]